MLNSRILQHQKDEMRKSKRSGKRDGKTGKRERIEDPRGKQMQKQFYRTLFPPDTTFIKKAIFYLLFLHCAE